MKRTIVLFVLSVMLFSLVGCKKTKNEEFELDLETESAGFENSDIPNDEPDNKSDDGTEDQPQVYDEKNDTDKDRAQVNNSGSDSEKDEENTNQPPTYPENNNDPTGDMLIETPTFDQAVASSNDIFIGEIMTVSPINKKVEFDNVTIADETPKLYTVKVVDVLKGQVVTTDSVIRVVHFVIDADGDESWVKDYEIGKQYLIGGRVQPFDEKPILLDNSRITSEVDKNGNLIPISKTAQTVFKKVKTLSELLTYKNDPVVWTGREGDISEMLFEAVKQNTNANEKITLNTVTDYLKEAIKTDSDVTLTVSTTSSEQVS